MMKSFLVLHLILLWALNAASPILTPNGPVYIMNGGSLALTCEIDQDAAFVNLIRNGFANLQITNTSACSFRKLSAQDTYNYSMTCDQQRRFTMVKYKVNSSDYNTTWSCQIYSLNSTDLGTSLVVKVLMHDVPEVPSYVMIIEITQTSVTVQWMAGNNGGAPQTFHVVASAGNLTHKVTVADPGYRQNGTAVLEGLQPGTKYNIYMVAINSVGSSNMTEAFIVTTLEDVPEVPSYVMIIEITQTSVTVQWMAGNNGGAPQTFHVVASAGNLTHKVTVADPGYRQNGTAVLEGLQPGTKYNIYMVAINSVGSSNMTEAIIVTRLEDVPEVPSYVMIIEITQTSVTVQWMAGNNGGAPQTFHVVASAGNLTHKVTVSDPGYRQNGNAVLESLQPGTNYSIYMVAINSVGSSNMTEAIIVTTLEDAAQEFSPGISVSWVAVGVSAGVTVVLFVSMCIFLWRRYRHPDKNGQGVALQREIQTDLRSPAMLRKYMDKRLTPNIIGSSISEIPLEVLDYINATKYIDSFKQRCCDENRT